METSIKLFHVQDCFRTIPRALPALVKTEGHPCTSLVPHCILALTSHKVTHLCAHLAHT